MTHQKAYNLGVKHAEQGKAPAFREFLNPATGKVMEYETAFSDDDMAEGWSQEDRRSYLEGYDDYLSDWRVNGVW